MCLPTVGSFMCSNSSFLAGSTNILEDCRNVRRRTQNSWLTEDRIWATHTFCFLAWGEMWPGVFLLLPLCFPSIKEYILPSTINQNKPLLSYIVFNDIFRHRNENSYILSQYFSAKMLLIFYVLILCHTEQDDNDFHDLWLLNDKKLHLLL